MQLYDFAWIPDMTKQLETLVKMIGSHEGEWGGAGLPHLYYYIHNMFIRAEETNKIWTSGDENWCCFNTGLVYISKEEDFACNIYGLFQANRIDGKQPWYFKGFYFPGHGVLNEQFPKLPSMPIFSDPYGLIFNPVRPIYTNYEKVVEQNIPILTEYYGELERTEMIEKLKRHINAYKVLVRRTPSIVLPHPFNGVIQFIMPIGLGLYLVLREDEVRESYAATIIIDEDTMNMYANLINLPVEPSQQEMMDLTGLYSGFSKPEVSDIPESVKQKYIDKPIDPSLYGTVSITELLKKQE
jgi:hypothetical protein